MSKQGIVKFQIPTPLLRAPFLSIPACLQRVFQSIRNEKAPSRNWDYHSRKTQITELASFLKYGIMRVSFVKVNPLLMKAYFHGQILENHSFTIKHKGRTNHEKWNRPQETSAKLDPIGTLYRFRHLGNY